jgi:hypothetical protein
MRRASSLVLVVGFSLVYATQANRNFFCCWFSKPVLLLVLVYRLVMVRGKGVAASNKPNMCVSWAYCYTTATQELTSPTMHGRV